VMYIRDTMAVLLSTECRCYWTNQLNQPIFMSINFCLRSEIGCRMYFRLLLYALELEGRCFAV
jgi:hypothetical protein